MVSYGGDENGGGKSGEQRLRRASTVKQSL
jgi:hypothetical protein